MAKQNNVKGIIIVAIGLILFCSAPVIYGVFPIDALPMTFIGAAMGAIITAGITFFLLTKQSQAQELLLEKQQECQKRLLATQSQTEEEKELHVKIFEKKSKLYQEFIDQVWKIWKDEKITCDQYEIITSDYYKNLMIYIKEPSRLKKIGVAISNLGDCLEKESYKNTQELHKNAIDIINTLSEDLDLGGQIDRSQIADHDHKLFIVKFRKAMRESFNKIFVSSYSDILKEGDWLQWKEGPNTLHDSLVFNCRNHPNYSVRFGFGKNENNETYNQEFLFFFIVGSYRRIPIRGYENLLKYDSPIIEPFNFEKEEVIKIRERDHYHEIAEALAQRAKEVFSKITVSNT